MWLKLIHTCSVMLMLIFEMLLTKNKSEVEVEEEEVIYALVCFCSNKD